MRCFKNEAQNRPLCEFRQEKTPVFKRPWRLLTSLCVAAREFLSFGSPRHKCSPKESPPSSLIGREKKHKPVSTGLLPSERSVQGGGQVLWFSLKQLTLVMTPKQLHKLCLTLQLHVYAEANLKLI